MEYPKSKKKSSPPVVLQPLVDAVQRPIDEVQKERIWQSLQRIIADQPDALPQPSPKLKTRRYKMYRPAFYGGMAGIAVFAIGIGITLTHTSHSDSSRFSNKPRGLTTFSGVHHSDPRIGIASTKGSTNSVLKATVQSTDLPQEPTTIPVTFPAISQNHALAQVAEQTPYVSYTESVNHQSVTYVTSLLDGKTEKVSAGDYQLWSETPQGVLLFQDTTGMLSFAYQPGQGIIRTFPRTANNSTTGVTVSATNQWALIRAQGPDDEPYVAKHWIDINHRITPIPLGSLPLTGAWSPNGNTLAVLTEQAGNHQQLQLLDVENSKVDSLGSQSHWTMNPSSDVMSTSEPWGRQHLVQWTQNGWVGVTTPTGIRLWNVNQLTQSPTTLRGSSNWVTAGSDIVSFANSSDQTTVTYYHYENNQWSKASDPVNTAGQSQTLIGSFVQAQGLPNGQVLITTDQPTTPYWLVSPGQQPVALRFPPGLTQLCVDVRTHTVYALSHPSTGGTSGPPKVWKLVLPNPVASTGGISH